MTDVTLTHETTSQTPAPPAASGDYPMSTLCLRLDIDGVGLSWTLRGDDSDVASRLPRVLDYIKRLQAKLPKPEPTPAPETPRPQAVPARETPPQCLYHGAMKESTKAPGTFFCPKRLSSGEFCKEKWPHKAGERAS